MSTVALSGIITPSNVVTATSTTTLTNKTLTAPTIASANLTTALTLAGAAGNNGQVLTSAGSGNAPIWTTISSSPTIVRSPRTSNTILGTADSSTLIDITSGTFSQTFTAAATLGSGWFCYIQNSGTGYVTLDPNASETITRNGVAHTTWVLLPQEAALIVCNGTGFFYTNLQKGSAVQTISSNVTSLVFSTGLAYRQQMRLSWARVGVDANTQIKLYLNTSNLPDKNSLLTVNGTSFSGSGAGGTGDNFTLGTGTAAANTGSDLMRGYFDFILNQNTVSSFGPQQYKTTTTSLYGVAAQVWNSINESTITNITIEVGSPNNFNAGTFTLTEL